MNVRPLTFDDAETVAALVRAESESGKLARVTAVDIRSWWVGADLTHASWLFAEDGEPVAAGWYHGTDELGRLIGVVATAAKGRGLGAALADRGEEVARARGARRLEATVLPHDLAARRLFEGRGFREVRRYVHMTVDLTAAPPEPVILGGLSLEPFREPDAEAFHSTMIEAFAGDDGFVGTPFPEWWKRRRGQAADGKGPIWFVVRDGDAIAAVVRNEVSGEDGYVALLAVREPWRGRGLGRALLLRSFAAFWERGLVRATLSVDADNRSGARRLYERVGMTVESETVDLEKTLA